MGTKTTGNELKAFHGDDAYWQTIDESKDDSFWHEDLVLEVNGIEQTAGFDIARDLNDTDKVVIVAGWVLSRVEKTDAVSFESFFKAWRRIQSTAYLTVKVHKDNLESVKAAIRAAGGVVS